MFTQIPTEEHLARMYHELSQIGARCVGANRTWPYKPASKEELLALACDISRFDPRLFDILVEYFMDHWKDLDPLKMRTFYKKMKTPQTVAVILEFLTGASTDRELRFFAEYLIAGLKPIEQQFYFHDLYSPGGKLGKRAVEEGVYEFKKWGFFSAERPTFNTAKKDTLGRFDAVSRKNILQRLIEEKKEIRLKDYLEATKFSISRQQALLDIKALKLEKTADRGRGTMWHKAA